MHYGDISMKVYFFIYSVTSQEIEARYLQLSVFDFDRFARHDLIGHVTVDNLTEVVEHGLQDFEYTMPILCPPVVSFNDYMYYKCFVADTILQSYSNNKTYNCIIPYNDKRCEYGNKKLNYTYAHLHKNIIR